MGSRLCENDGEDVPIAVKNRLPEKHKSDTLPPANSTGQQKSPAQGQPVCA